MPKFLLYRQSAYSLSYAHKDAEQVQLLAEGYRALDNLEYFFDRHKLRPGDEFESKIFEYIDKSDLFILCWSKNAAESEWVTKERLYAFQKYLEGKGVASKRIRIYPLSMKPTADLPTDMGNILNFGQLI